MRTLRAEFESGNDLLSAYWNFLRTGGLVVQVVEPATEGEQVVLVVRVRSLKKEYTFRGVVARKRDERTFVAFSGDEDPDGMINAAWADGYATPERKHRRYEVREPVVYRMGGEERTATLVNLSRGGCCIEALVTPPMGVRVRLDGAGVIEDAVVRWVQGPAIGLEFVTPLEYSGVDLLRR